MVRVYIYISSYADWSEFGYMLLFTRIILETGGAERDLSKIKRTMLLTFIEKYDIILL